MKSEDEDEGRGMREGEERQGSGERVRDRVVERGKGEE